MASSAAASAAAAAAAAASAASAGPVVLLELNHVTVVVADLDRAAAFYANVLGFVPTARPPFRVQGRWLFHQRMKIALHLLVGTTPARPWKPTLALDQRDHINFLVQDMDAAAATLEAFGIAYLKLQHPDLGFTQIFCADPDGNVIELGTCGVPEGMIACDNVPIAARTDLTPNDVHPVVRDTFLNAPSLPL